MGVQQRMAVTDDDFFSRAKTETGINVEAPLHLTSLFVQSSALTTIINVTSGLGGKGLHDQAPPVSAFIDTIFEQLKAGKTELTFGFSEVMAKAGPEDLKQAFQRMNGAG